MTRAEEAPRSIARCSVQDKVRRSRVPLSRAPLPKQLAGFFRPKESAPRGTAQCTLLIRCFALRLNGQQFGDLRVAQLRAPVTQVNAPLESGGLSFGPWIKHNLCALLLLIAEHLVHSGSFVDADAMADDELGSISPVLNALQQWPHVSASCASDRSSSSGPYS